MKLNKSTILAAVTLAVLSVALATSAKAQILYDFQVTFAGNPNPQSGGGAYVNPPDTSLTGSAVLGSSTDPTWDNMGAFAAANNFGQRGNNVALNTTTGATGATISWGGNNSISSGVNAGTNTGTNLGSNGSQPVTLADPGTVNLFRTNLYTNSAAGQYFDIAGLADNQAYTLVLYYGGNGAPARPADWSVSGASTYLGYSSNASYSIADGQGVAYAELNVVSSALGTLNITETSANHDYFALNGLQLQSVAAVPEPSSLSLIGCGVAAMVLLARARRRIIA